MIWAFGVTICERGRPSCVIVLVSIMLLAHFLLFLPEEDWVRADHTWVVEIADNSPESNGWKSSIILDSNNLPHISYYGGKNGMGALKYAHFDGFSWNITYVDSSPIYHVGDGTSLVLDSTEKPHIAYYDVTNEDLKYAYWNGSGWINETVDSDGEVGRLPWLALDSSNHPYISYVNSTYMGVNLARKDGTSWKIETLDFTGLVVSLSVLELDSMDRPHVVYSHDSNNSLRYATWNGSSWIFRSVPILADLSFPFGFSMDLDSVGRPHIAYTRDIGIETTELRYLSWNGTDWKDELIRVDSHSGWEQVSLGLDSRDRPHVAYVPPDSRYMLYLYKDNSSWHSETVDYRVQHLGDPSIALDSFDMPHISYGRASGPPFNLWYAHINSPPIPDMAIFTSDISFDPSSPVPNGTSVGIRAWIYNLGFGDAFDVSVRFHDGFPALSNEIAEENISRLNHLEAIEVQTNWTSSGVGFHDICIVVDPENNIIELNESNNQACRQVEVYSSEAPGPPIIMDASLSGYNIGNITLTWELSPDDGKGLNNVIGYDIVRGTIYDSTGFTYPVHASLLAGNSSFVDASAGEGDPNDYFYMVCAIGDSNISSCSPNQAAKFTRPLAPGPNLVSVPFIQSNESIETVLQTVKYDKAWSYDISSQKWKWHMTYKGYRRGLFNINHTMGIWVNVTQNSNLTVAGVVPAITRIQLYAGWNLVGFPSFNSSLTVSDMNATVGAIRVEGFDSSAAPFYTRVLEASEVLQAGFGYWVRVEADTDWIVEVS